MKIHKICRICKKNKPLSDFYARKGMKDGHVNSCKQCCYTASKAYREAHRELYRECTRKYVEKNRSKVRSASRKYYADNKETCAKRHKDWIVRNKDHVNKYARDNRYRYRERVNAYARKRRKEDPVWYHYTRLLYPIRYVLKRLGNCNSKRAEEITGLESKALFDYLAKTWEERYGSAYTGQPCDIDHIKPIRLAKTTEEVDRFFHYTNLQLLTPEDNRRKA